MRNVIIIPHFVQKVDTSILNHYEILVFVANKVLKQLVSKISINQKMTPQETITVYETSMIFFIMLRQANHFNFSDFDLVRLHNFNEMKIAAKSSFSLSPKN